MEEFGKGPSRSRRHRNGTGKTDLERGRVEGEGVEGGGNEDCSGKRD